MKSITEFNYMEGSLYIAVGSMYAKEYFSSEMKKAAEYAAENIQKEFNLMLEELMWIDSKTKALVHKKLHDMKAHIAYPEEILDRKLIGIIYEGLKLDSQSYFENILTLKKFMSDYKVKEFKQDTDKQSWKTHGMVTTVDAYYNPTDNSILIPAGILDGVLYQSDWPNYMNYGSLGMLAGHEITHGFDDQGSQYDEEGNLVDLWEPSTKKQFNLKARCIIEHYGNLTVDVDGQPMSVNGINAQEENIADIGGAKGAIRAYARHTL